MCCVVLCGAVMNSLGNGQDEDLHKLVQSYRQWAFTLFPKAHFMTFVRRLESFGSTDSIQVLPPSLFLPLFFLTCFGRIGSLQKAKMSTSVESKTASEQERRNWGLSKKEMRRKKEKEKRP